MQKRKVILAIMDGWGIAPKTSFNAIANANTPNVTRLIREYPNTQLKADGLAVGLPEGQFGTSEVNHLTIGSGRVIFQDLPKINLAIKSGTFFENRVLLDTFAHVTKEKSSLQLIGLFSDGGVHSHIEHMFALFDMADKLNSERPIYLHLFSDGRDVPPQSIRTYIKMLNDEIKKHPKLKISVATLQGRVFLDRDREWSKTEIAFQLIRHGKGNEVTDMEAAVNLAYNTTKTDEFLSQFLLNKEGLLKKGDAIFFFHYRTDRAYQLAKRIQEEKLEDTFFSSFVEYSEELDTVKAAFPRDEIKDSLAEALFNAEKRQLHLAETEKFPHVTYFLNGEREAEYPNEKWVSKESNRFVKPMYNFEPSMRNFDLAKEIIAAINGDEFDFVIVNFSSPDMVGHTGNYNAAVVSAESLDYCMGEIYKALEAKLNEWALLITADHGNSEIMWDEKNQQPHTQHTLSPVPFIMVTDIKAKLDRKEGLENIAPTILDLMGIEKPAAMVGTSLLIREE